MCKHDHSPALLNQVLATADSAARPTTTAAVKENLMVPDQTTMIVDGTVDEWRRGLMVSGNLPRIHVGCQWEVGRKGERWDENENF
jgi:hypothetical protein